MDVKSVAVIGAGTLGRGIACAVARAGYKAIFEDVSYARLEQAVSWIRAAFDDDVAQGKITGSARDAALQSLSTVNTVEDALRDADLIIETLPEEMEMKIELFTIFDRFAKPNAIFASSSASLSITEMAEVTFCADRCIGMRFADPVRDANLLELVRGQETSEQTIAICAEAGRRMGKEVIVVDEPGRGTSAGAAS
jgi:3-hydroxybutyryl-CoA dehydrogenase